MTVPFRERLIFDAAQGTLFDETRRYMMIRPEALMGIFRRLPSGPRMEALEALKASILEQGSDSARAYVAHAGTTEGLLQIIPETAAELGWGAWTLSRSDEGLTLDVTGSPFAAGFTPSDMPVCHAITGMLQGVATILTGQPTLARETHCAARDGGTTCSFHTRPDRETP